MSKKLYYCNGKYCYKESGEKTRTHWKRKILWASIATLIIGVYIKFFVYTEQYYWSNDLVEAIQCQDIKTVEKLLSCPDMDVNQSGGVEFPMYLIPVSGFIRTSPIEEACWQGNYDITKLLIDYGAEENLDEALMMTIEEYNPDDVEIIELLIEHSAKFEKGLAQDAWISAYEIDYYAEMYNMSIEEIEHDIDVIRTMVKENCRN